VVGEIPARGRRRAHRLCPVKKFRADGEALHQAGKHKESIDTLAKAMKVLGI
jgi:hypothetical protein